VADTAKAHASQLAETASSQAREVVQQATQQAKSVVGQLQDDLRARADEEASKLARTLHDAGRQMASMANANASEQSVAADLALEGARAVERVASHIDDGGIDRVVADARSWARRHPGGFLLGAAVAGFLVGRVARNVGGPAGRGGLSPAVNDRADPIGIGYVPASPVQAASSRPGPETFPAGSAIGPTGAGAIE
jgi:hypothetical protein